MTLFKILNVIIEDEHNRTDHEGNINIYWNMAFKCAFSRIFYAAHKSLLGCIKHESDCVAAYTIAAEGDPDGDQAATGWKLRDLETAQAVTDAARKLKDFYDKLHYDLTGDDFDVVAYEETFPGNGTRKKSATNKIGKKKMNAVLKAAQARLAA